MQTTSATWTQLWESGTAWLECKAIINGVEYTGIVPAINRALTQGGLSIGNAVAATCQFTIHTDNVIPKSAKVEIKKRLTDGTTSSEWLNAGTYFISRRTKDVVTGTISLECYDSMLKSNAVITDVPWSDSDGNVITTDTGEWIYFTTSYPRRMVDMAEDIALLLGVELDPRSQIKTGSSYIIKTPEAGATVNDILCQIANANGGNWIISQDNKLWLVPVLSAADAEAATDNVIDVEGIVGNIGVNSVGVVTGVRYQSEDRPVILGDDTGIVLDVDSAVFAYALYDELIGIVYSSFSLNSAIYNPAAELGDYVRGGANGEIRSVLFSENCTLGMAFRGDISAQEAGEMDDEYPYMGRSDKVLIASKAYAVEVGDDAKEYANGVGEDAKDYAQSAAQTAQDNAIAATNALNNALDQEGVFNRLTNYGEAQGIYLQDGKIYVSATYIRTGILTLGGIDNIRGQLQVLDANGDVVGTWNNAGLTMEKGRISLKINNGAGSVVVGAGNNAIYYHYTDSNDYEYRQQMYNDTLNLSNRTMNNYTYFRNNDINMWRNTDTTDAVIGTDIAINMNNEIAGKRLWIQSKYGIQLMEKSGSAWVTQTSLRYTGISTSGNVTIGGNLSVAGTKPRLVTTDQYSKRYLYCYETPTPMFGDIGEGTIGEDGLCYISLDAVFAQTVVTQQYQVFLQRYGEGECWVKERKGAYFIVQGTPGLAFGWEVKAKQRDYDQLRLERADEPFAVPEQTYGQDAASYIEKLEKGRIPDEDSNKRNGV